MFLKKCLGMVLSVAMALTTMAVAPVAVKTADAADGAQTGSFTATLDDKGGVNCTLFKYSSISSLEPNDTLNLTVTPGEGVDSSNWNICFQGYTTSWGGWQGPVAENGSLTFSATVQEILEKNDITDVSGLGGINICVYNMTEGQTLDYSFDITKAQTGPQAPKAAISLKAAWSIKDTVKIEQDGQYTVSTTGLNMALENNVIMLTASTEEVAKLGDDVKIKVDDIVIDGEHYTAPAKWQTATSPINAGNGEVDVPVWNSFNTDEAAQASGLDSTMTVNDVSITFTISGTGLTKADTLYTQKTPVANGTYSQRFIKMVEKTEAQAADSVEVKLSNGTKTVTLTDNHYFASISVAGDTLTAPEGFVYVGCVVVNIPEDVAVSCTSCELK